MARTKCNHPRAQMRPNGNTANKWCPVCQKFIDLPPKTRRAKQDKRRKVNLKKK